MTGPEAVVCSRCGRHRKPDDDPVQALAWVAEHERGRTSWLCPECARAHVRDIEGKLPTEYW